MRLRVRRQAGADWPVLPALPGGGLAGVEPLLPPEARRAALDARGLAPEAALDQALALLARSGLQKLDLLYQAPWRLRPALAEAGAALRGMRLARRLLRQGVARPKDLARRLKRLRRHGLAVQVLKRRQLELAGFDDLLAAAAGARHAPRLVVLRWPGESPLPPVLLVGQGLLAAEDGVGPALAGAAAAAGTMLTLALRRHPHPVAAILALAEPGPDATPAAEDTAPAAARLLLADGLRYAQQAFRPGLLLGLGWLSGPELGLLQNDAGLAARLRRAAAGLGLALPPAAAPVPPPELPWAHLDMPAPGGAEAGLAVRLLDRLLAPPTEAAPEAAPEAA